MKSLVLCQLASLSLLVLFSSHGPLATAAEPTATPATKTKPAATNAQAAAANWHDNYADAVRTAIAEKKMLLIYFEGPVGCTFCRRFEKQALTDPAVVAKLDEVVALHLPIDASITSGGKQVMLIHHPAFAEMQRCSGVAIMDLTDRESPHFHQVVSVLPFTRSRYSMTDRTSRKAMLTLLGLPAGTLTQRTMIFAVRMHHEAPASAFGKFEPTLAKAARDHSKHQADITNQGHHNWESRFHQISAQLPAGHTAQEVVAESWPGESLVDAAEDCVHSWRQSSGHWGAVRSRQPLFGYDIKRGRNGIWYATGIFGRR